MEAGEVGQVLAMVATYDPYGRREPDRAQRSAWSLAIAHSYPDLTLDLAARAVVQYHAEATRPMGVADLIRVSREISDQDRAAEARARLEAQRERHALPAGARPEPVNVRDRKGDVAKLLTGLMERYRNWDVVGDAKTRATQAGQHPELAAKGQEARHARAMRIAQERSAERARRVAAGLDPIGAGPVGDE